VAFSPNGTEVLTGSSDRTARIWEVSSGKELHKLPHGGQVNAVAFSPDGKKVLTGSYDGTAWIWPVSDRDLIEQACDCMPENLTVEQWGRYPISDVKTCPKEGQFNQSALTRFLNDPKGFLTGSDECQPCIAEAFRNRK
jgi:WD40 repeat protein